MGNKYYLVMAGERRGPFLRAELEAQGLRRDTLVWCKGLPDWVPAGRVAELLDVFEEPPPVPGADGPAVPAAVPVPPPGAPLLAASEQFKDPSVNLARLEPEPPPYLDEAPEFDQRYLGLRCVRYDRVGLRRLYLASTYCFVPGLIALLVGGALIAYLGTFGPGGMAPRFDANARQVVHDFERGTRAFRTFLAISTACAMLLGAIAVIVGIACYCVLLYRAWAVVQDGRTTPSPGKAVGFLFIPFFNTYWFYVAVYGLARKLNLYVRRYDLDAPTASQPLGFAVALYLVLMYVPIPFAAAFALGLLLIVLPFFMRSIYQTAAAIGDEANQERIAHAPPERLLYQPELTRPLSAHILSIVAMALAPIGTVVFVIAYGVDLHAFEHYQRDARLLQAHRDGVEHLRKAGALNGADQNLLRMLEQQARNLDGGAHRWNDEVIVSSVVLALGLLLIGLSIGLAVAAGHCARAQEEADVQPPAWPLSQGVGLLAKNAPSP